jgi:hypothetical protein
LIRSKRLRTNLILINNDLAGKLPVGSFF